MSPLVRGALAVALVSAVVRGAEFSSGANRAVREPAGPARKAALSSTCPAHTLPDGEVCIPVPRAEEPATLPPGSEPGRWQLYARIPRRPERPEDYGAYELPIRPTDAGTVTAGGLGHSGGKASSDAQNGVEIPASLGQPVRLAALENQQGPSRVVFVGPLFGTTVATLHSVRDRIRERYYIAFFGHLANVAPGVEVGKVLSPGALLGNVGDSGSPGRSQLHIEMRLVRHGVEAEKLTAQELTEDSKTIPTDLRNAFPLRHR